MLRCVNADTVPSAPGLAPPRDGYYLSGTSHNFAPPGPLKELQVPLRRGFGWVFRHFCCDLLRLVGMRDRLRCPRCSAVGTWKPHGGWLDREDDRKVRRWMCKWCGYYQGPEWTTRVTLGERCWELCLDGKPDTPMIRSAGANPWRG